MTTVKAVIQDQYLLPFEPFISERLRSAREVLNRIDESEKSLSTFAGGFKAFGLQDSSEGWTFVEYLPGAKSVSLVGEFNSWNPLSHKLEPSEFGRWKISLPKSCGLKHGQRYKMEITTTSGEIIHRVPAWANYVLQNPETRLFDAVVNSLPKYTFKHAKPIRPKSLRIYEAHIGMSSEEGKISTYTEFRINVLPRIARLGYNTIQLMAIQEHAYYGSFGYHVTSFFAPSSRFGTPNDLRELIDTAHALGLTVLMDIVHSHMSKSFHDGIACIDGTDHCYTHSGLLGQHELWDSALFDYAKWETLRFLLSNCRYWIEEFAFDGFRFDGITSMLYKHHGIGYGFSGNYAEYFGDQLVDMNACIYLMIANTLIHSLNGISIAEDVSGMPLLCRPVEPEGGLGFDYRLAMAIPDMWINLLKHQTDESWDMGNIVHTLTNKRWNEKTIAYTESHDQAIVGDKTIAMWLMDSAIYTSMNNDSQSLVIDRGIALHKMIRLISMSLGNDGYLAFMGNEFGHPEWIDFPREGNGWSHHWCRRQWHLTDCGFLRYTGLENFDSAMMQFAASRILDENGDEFIFVKDEELKIISFERNGFVFVFNFHPSNCLVDFPIPTRSQSALRVILDSDELRFGGCGNRISHACHMVPGNGFVKVYIPPRCCAILGSADDYPLGIKIELHQVLVGKSIRYDIHGDRAFGEWEYMTATSSIAFPGTESVKIWLPNFIPYGVCDRGPDAAFRREDAFEISLSGHYKVDSVGRVIRL